MTFTADLAKLFIVHVVEFILGRSGVDYATSVLVNWW